MKDEEKSAERKNGAGVAVDEGRSGAGTWPRSGLHGAASNQAASRGGSGGGGGGDNAAASSAAGIRVLKRSMKRNGSWACMNRKTRFGSRERDWLKGVARRGCVCLYGATEAMTAGPQTSSMTQPDLRLVLCSTSTKVEELCAQCHDQGLYLQLHGDLIRRLDPSERPFRMVYDYLTTTGYSDPVRVQQEAANSDLSCMIRFYTDGRHSYLHKSLSLRTLI